MSVQLINKVEEPEYNTTILDEERFPNKSQNLLHYILLQFFVFLILLLTGFMIFINLQAGNNPDFKSTPDLCTTSITYFTRG